MITATEFLEKAIVENALRDRAKAEAVKIANAQPQVVYVPAPGQAPRSSGFPWFKGIIGIAVITAAFVVGHYGLPLSITPTDISQQTYTTTVARPTAAMSAIRPIQTVVIVPQTQPQVQVQVPVVIEVTATSVPIPEPIVQEQPVQDVIVQATPGTQPQYQYDPSKPNGLEAKTTGEFEGWNGGGGSGWVIPEAKVDGASVQPTSSASAMTKDTTGWGGGGGSGWDVPAADNGAWTNGN